jgi:hypothetical protein
VKAAVLRESRARLNFLWAAAQARGWATISIAPLIVKTDYE